MRGAFGRFVGIRMQPELLRMLSEVAPANGETVSTAARRMLAAGAAEMREVK